MAFSTSAISLHENSEIITTSPKDFELNSERGRLSSVETQRSSFSELKKDQARSFPDALDRTRCNSPSALANDPKKTCFSNTEARTFVGDAGASVKAEKPQEKHIDISSSTSASPLKSEPSTPTCVATLRAHWLGFRTWFTPYRQLLIIVAGLNAALVVAIAAGALGGASQDLSVMVIVNVLIAIAIRNEWIIRLVYRVSIKCFRSARISVRIRKSIVGLLYHIGGLHSGCGTSALFWLALSAYRHFRRPELYHPAVLTLLTISVACILITCLTAMPVVRGPRHDLFEIVHRFIGWLGIISTLLFVVLGHVLAKNGLSISWQVIAGDAQFWMMLAILILIISSWVTTSHVPVEVFASSQKATVVKCPGGLTSGLHSRISRGGLQEWHIFGTISEGKHADCHYLVAAVQGDFTRNLNLEQPTRLYTKKWKPAGLPYFSRMFHRGVAICTGSGIGAIASTCIQHDDWFLIWIGPELEKTYGRPILDLIERTIPPERRLIWDTRGPMGRPDVFSLLARTYSNWCAEVVLFIGSPALNQSVLRSSREAKIPLFGSIWDA
ncbi:hypothetical protein CROQUDRAFT_36595 [Cronartium quercuum f. sp. fusiforme G11]|uniref:Uncharacterized protein n=1 Tax=Cronartium quercuum f. sp. fusiforme G11 TaxID=708437 RepID=A0A9P6NY62_9BASI|nr:hypothetical protein CROQUDRAFT_36595 [Cronartium quercuum f. sp. fusiforme G11]